MNYRIITFTLALLIFGVGAVGCSEGAQVSTGRGKTLDRKVLELQPGTSLGEVRSELGTPRLEKNLGDEEVLYYGPWQLVFTDRGLETRTRYYRSGWHPGADIRTLDHKVLKLQLGISIKDVRARLGTPEALEVYQNAPHKEESLWYGNGRWKLNFTNRELTGRARF